MGTVAVINTFRLWELATRVPDVQRAVDVAPGPIDVDGNHVYKAMLDHVDVDGRESERGVLFMKVEGTMDPYVARVDVPRGLVVGAS